jgi:hypothetical protein
MKRPNIALFVLQSASAAAPNFFAHACAFYATAQLGATRPSD